MSAIYNLAAPKKAANLSINSDLLHKAKLLHINLSQILEQKLAEIVQQQIRQQWLTENKEAIEAYNARVTKQGVFSDKIRRF